MGDLEFLFLLLGGAAVLVRVADIVRVPYPIVLVLGGLAAGLIPDAPELELEAEVVFLVFLPPLLHSAGWYASPQELREEWRPLALMSLGLVVVTVVAVAVVAHALVDGMSWGAAVVLGAVLAPTDPVAAIATFARLGVPERVRLLVEGDAMLNDAVPLVAFGIAAGVAAGEAFSAGDAALEFAGAAAGGVVVGLAVGWVVRWVLVRQHDQALSIFITVVAAYAGYVIGEELHVSGVLGAVVSGLYLGWNRHELFDAEARLSAGSFWDVLLFILNATLFVLLGLQFPGIVDELREELSIGSLVVAGLGVTAVVVVVRLAWLFVPDPGLGDGPRERLLVGWAGMRGAISLAAALSVPPSVGEREEIIFLTVVVILLTLVGQGLTLPALIRVLGLPGERVWSSDEAVARLEAAQAALDRLDDLEESDDLPEEDRDRLDRIRGFYQARFRRCLAALDGEDGASRAAAEPRARYRELRLELIGIERAELLSLRDAGRVRADVLRLIERDLDLEEARLRAG